MGFDCLPLLIRRGRPEDVVTALDDDPVLRKAERQGLVERRVLFDPSNPRRGLIEMWWKSPAQMRRFAEENPRLTIRTDEVSVQSTGKHQLYVSAKKLRRST
jgi:hypothetical protein